MNQVAPIRAVIFDMGGTLEQVYFDDTLRQQATHGLLALLEKYNLGSGMNAIELFSIVKAGMARYNLWREETCLEASPERQWSEFVLIDHRRFPQDQVESIGEQLAFYYDINFYTRKARPEAKEMLEALRSRGFRLGVISNIFSRQAVPHNLARYGLAEYFQAILCSSAIGYRKPDPRIFMQAAGLLGMNPAECAYVGDTISRDVVGAHRAGYRRAIQIKSFLTRVSDKETDTEQPDAVIDNLMQVVELVQNTTELI